MTRVALFLNGCRCDVCRAAWAGYESALPEQEMVGSGKEESVTARADDLIVWGPPESTFDLCLVFGLCLVEPISLAHGCPMAVVGTLATREQLDPMALGSCRYCGAKLPTSNSTTTKGAP